VAFDGAKDVTPHTLRHTFAMNLLRHGVDAATIALWLGHEEVRTTYSVCLHANLTLEETAIAKTAPPGTRPPTEPSTGRQPCSDPKVRSPRGVCGVQVRV